MKPRDFSSPQVHSEIKAQGDVNSLNQDGLGLFHIAVMSGDAEDVNELLKDKEININQPDKNGRTPVFIAAQYGNVEILKLLAEAKANLTQPNYFNCSPFEIAAYRKHQNVLDTLTEFKVAPPVSPEQKIQTDYKALYDVAEHIRVYPKRKIRMIGVESVEEEKLRLEHDANCEKFEAQFRVLLDKFKQWGQEIKRGCNDEKHVVEIEDLKKRFFAENYSGSQPVVFFNTVKQNIEQIWFILQLDKSVTDKKKIEEYIKLCRNMYVCAPGFYAHVEHALNNLTAKVAIDYWLAELRTTIINQYADKHVKEFRIEEGFSPHIFTVFLIYALNEGWAPLSKITKEIEVFAGSAQARIDKDTTYKSLTKFFEESYTPQTIAECLSANVYLAICKIRDSLNLREEKGQEILATPEFVSEMKKLVNTFNLKAEDINFFDFSDDGKYAKFNAEMFKIIFLKSCKASGAYFHEDSWHEISLADAYKYYNCQHQAGWFEKEDKPYNIIVNWHKPDEGIDPAILLGKFIAQLPINELPAIRNLRSTFNDGADLAKVLVSIPKENIQPVLENFYDVKAGNTLLKLVLNKGDSELINLVLDMKASLESTSDWNPLHYAIGHGNTEGVRILLQRNPSLMNTMGAFKNQNRKCPPLLTAIGHNQPNIVRLLVELKSPLITRYFEPIHFAAELGDSAMIHLLYELKVDINHLDANGYNALTSAFNKEGDNSSVIKTLLSCKIDANLEQNKSLPYTVVHLAVRKNMLGAIKAFAEDENVNFNVLDWTGLTPFQVALKERHFDIIKELIRLNKAGDINRPDQEGATAVFNAAKDGDAVMLTLFLEAKADANKPNYFNCTPMQIAEHRNHQDVLAILKSYIKPLHAEQAVNDLPAKLNIDYWLAELRTNIIHQFSHNNEFAPNTACLAFALNEGWAPLNKLPKQMIAGDAKGFLDEKASLALTKHFKEFYTSYVILICVTSNVISAINRICDALSLKEVRSRGIPVVEKFFPEVDKLFKLLDLKFENSSSLFYLSEDGKYAQFNTDMFHAVFLKYCRENGKYFHKNSWREIPLTGGYKYYNFKNNVSWFEKEEKSENSFVIFKSPLLNADPAQLLGLLVEKLPLTELKFIKNFSVVIKNKTDLVNFLTYLSKDKKEFVLNSFFEKQKIDEIIKQVLKDSDDNALQFLLGVKVRVDIMADWNPMQYALEYKNVSGIKTLLEYEQKVLNAATESKRGSNHVPELVIFNVIKQNKPEILKLLLNLKASVLDSNYSDNHLIYLATDLGHADVIKVLYESKVDINIPSDNLGKTTLMLAAEKNHAAAVRMLLACNADVNTRDILDQTALHYAVTANSLAAFKVLAENKEIDFNAREKLTGCTPAHMALRKDRPEIFRELMRQPSIDFNIQDNIEHTIFDFTMGFNKKEMAVYILMAMKPSVNLQLGGQNWSYFTLDIDVLTNDFIAIIKRYDKNDPERSSLLEQVMNKENLLGVLLHKLPQSLFAHTAPTETKSEPLSESIRKIMQECYEPPSPEEKKTPKP